jgi:hypothetical protein
MVAAANAVRRQRDSPGSAVGLDGRRAEQQLDALFSRKGMVHQVDSVRKCKANEQGPDA